jgi:DNA polymerase-3 subunit epsilon
VIDLETTGLSPAHRDRVAEIAVVRVSPDGRIEDEWSTLVNPERDLGPQHVHGIGAADVRLAPTFPQLAPFVVELLRGRVLVAHHAAFDARFLRHELRLAGIHAPLPDAATLCTMQLAATYLPAAPRGLAICCELAGVRHDGAHSALGDARATAGLLQYYLEVGGAEPHWTDAAAAARGLDWQTWDFVFAVRPVHRGAGRPTGHWLSSLADRLDRVAEPPQADDYLALLDLALLDRLVSATERDVLLRAAADAGLTRGQVETLHHGYLAALARAALADGVLTEDELGDLHVVAGQLGLDADDVARAIEDAGADGVATDVAAADGAVLGERPAFVLRVGDEVVLTGTMARAREDWLADARAAGLAPWPTVTRRTRLVVAADPDSLSGKARTARRYGVPVVTEDAFARLLAGVVAG